MNITDCKEGMNIRISHDISTTHSRFDSCDDMRSMKGKVFSISRYSVSNKHVIIAGYTWDPGDLLMDVEDKVPEPNIFHFDEKTL